MKKGKKVISAASSGFLQEIYYQYQFLLSKLWKIVSPFSMLGGFLSLRDIDAVLRYKAIQNRIEKNQSIQVGAGFYSPLVQSGINVTTTDIYRAPGTMLLASAFSLPFSDCSFDAVVAIDTLEHLPKGSRRAALEEMMRVARDKVIVTVPLEDGKDFLGRQFDLKFETWYQRKHHLTETSTREHIVCGEPAPEEMSSIGFKIYPNHNAGLWFSYMRIQNQLTSWFAARFLLIIPYVYFLLNSRKNSQPPFWGGTCVFNK